MPNDLTTVTELGTALGTLAYPGVAEALAARPAALRVDGPAWDRLSELHGSGRFAPAFTVAFANGRAFLEAADGLRGRIPRIVEWTGGRRPPGDEVAPIDLRIDHVYLVSCKYRSENISSPSPARLFDGLPRRAAPGNAATGTRARRRRRTRPSTPRAGRRPASRRCRNLRPSSAPRTGGRSGKPFPAAGTPTRRTPSTGSCAGS